MNKHAKSTTGESRVGTNNQPSHHKQPGHGDDPAVSYARQQVDQSFGEQPVEDSRHLTRQFFEVHGHAPNQQAAWHAYYASLSPAQKYRLWQEYQSTQEQVGADQTAQPMATASEPDRPQNVAELKKQILERSKKRGRAHSHRLKPFLIAVASGMVVLFMNYNQLVTAQIKQFVAPSSTTTSPVIIDPNAKIAIGNEPRIIIPKINVDVPVVYDEKSFAEEKVQTALERGVVHYGTTALPGKPGNNVILGHSSSNFFNGGKYKYVFSYLGKLEKNDTFVLYFRGKRYVYRVYNKQIVDPKDFSVVQPTAKPTTTLITCTPPGTNWRRLIIQGEQISPAPSTKAPPQQTISADTAIVPGNAPSFVERIKDWLFN